MTIENQSYLGFRNDSGEAIPEYAVMRVVDVATAKGYMVLVCAKPDGTDALHVINSGSRVPAGTQQNPSFGSYLWDGPMPIATNQTSGSLGPASASWVAGSGDTWDMFGLIRTGVAFGVRKGGGGSAGIVWGTLTEDWDESTGGSGGGNIALPKCLVSAGYNGAPGTGSEVPLLNLTSRYGPAGANLVAIDSGKIPDRVEDRNGNNAFIVVDMECNGVAGGA